MKVLVISDSHGRLENFEKVWEKENDCRYFLHCGDIEGDEERFQKLPCPIAMVAGNMDFFSPLERELVIEQYGHRILLVHGNRERVGEDLQVLLYKALQNRCDVVCFGHTHVPLYTVQEGVTFVNPGSISKPRQIGHRPSYAILELSENEPVKVSHRYL